MDYERIETISKNLSHERINIRLRTATNLLQKLGDGIIDKDAFSNSACMTTLLSGVHKAIAQILENANDLADHNKESNELLQALMAILQATVKDPTRSNCVNISTKILEQLYFLKETENIDGTVKKSLDDAIGTLCGMDRSARTTHAAHVELDLRTAHLAGATYTSSQQLSTEPTQANSKFRGAGAILNSRLVHTGWKFPAFVLTERDERWLLDVQIKVKLQNDRAARDLWDVLEDFPTQAVLLNTHLLHGVLDLVGSPFSQADIDADPQGLHALSALKWLETLLQKCTHAFAVQLDGSLCTHSPYSEENHQGDGDIMPDLAGKLAKAMYALRHPSLPTTSTSTTTSNTTSNTTPSSLHPGPSVPGLAFACCAASLPLLQSRDTTVGRAVCSLVKVALPLVLEPRLLLSSQGQKEGGAEEVLLMEVEQGRLQHLLNRMEQLLAFFGDTFDIDAFLALIDEEDDNNNNTGTSDTSLQGHCFDLTFLSCVLTLFRAVPPSSLLPSSELDDGRQGKLSVGPLATQCLLKIAATSPALEALLPGCAAAACDTLSMINGVALGNIEAARRIFTTARIFTSPIDRTLLPGAVLEHFTYAAQACVSLLDASCTVSVPALQQTIAAALPILLQSAYERLDIDETEAEKALEVLCALMVRVLSCGAPAAKSVLLTHLHAWLTRSYELLPSPGAVTPSKLFSEQQVQLVKQLNLDASSGRQVASVLVTPNVVQALLHCINTATVTAVTAVTATENSEVNGDVSMQAQQVLEVLCAYSLQYHSCDFNHSSSTTSNTNNEGVHPWSHLLLPLKLAEWEAEHLHSNSNTPLDASFTDTSNNHSSPPSNAALTGFARRLQEACADSAYVSLKTAFARSLVVGLFHTDSAVRINSALRVRRDLLHVPLPTGLNDNSSDNGNGDESEGLYSVLAYDLFPAGGVLKLGPWQTNTHTTTMTTKTKATTMRVPNNSTFTHVNVRKVAAIGFSEVDASTRATALAQVVDLLKSDVHLLHTVDVEWAYTTVKNALFQLASLAPFMDGAVQNTLQYDVAALSAMPDAECRLFLQTMRVVVFFLTYFAALRTRVYFHAEKSTGGENYNAQSGILNVSVLLRLLLGTHLLQTKKSNNSSSTRITTTTGNIASTNRAGYEVLQQVAVECAQILSILTCTADCWAPLTTTHHSSDTDTMATAVGVKYEYTHNSVVGTPSVAIPAHLASRFLFPGSLSSSKNEYTMKYSDISHTAPRGKIAAAVLTIGNNNRGNNSSSGSGGGNMTSMTSSEAASTVAFAMVQLVCQPVQPVVYPPENILKLLVNSTHAPSADRIKTLTATKLLSFVIHASNHTSLRESLSCTLALCQADPLLLHVFVALRISLVTAVSHIVTVTPRTHKDHVTLSSVLDFLSTAFASLQRTTSNNTTAVVISPGFRAEVGEWFTEALSAVLPLMSQYLADHFHHVNAHSSHSSLALTESAKEHSVAAHTVCTSYFRLLRVLTAFVHPKYALSSVLSGHYVLSLLVHLASSELHGACDRAVSLRILENVVRLQEGGLQALCCIESPAYATLSGRSPKPNLSPTNYKSTHNISPGGKSRNLAAFAAEAEQFNVVDTLVRMLRLVRTPDSLQSHAAVVGALRLLLVALQRQRCDTNVSSSEYSLAQSERDWKWLIRLIYDRRSEVKVLAVQILALVLHRITTLKSGEVEDCDGSVDSLNGTDGAAKKEEKEGEKEEELVQWPPFELLTHLCSDSTESTALRLRALHALVTARLDLPVLYSAVQKHFKLPVVLGALHECLSVRDGDCAVTSSIHAALQLLTRLVTNRDETLVQDTLALCGAMKVTPLVVEVLNVRLQSSLHLRALRRVSVWEEEYISRGNTTYFQHDSLACSLRDNKDSSGYLLLGSGWRSLQLSHLSKDAEAVKDIRALASWFFFHLRAADPDIFTECVQRSTLLHHLVTSFSAVSANSSVLSSSLAPVFECGSVTAQAELLSLLIGLESSASPSSSVGALQSYVLQNEAVPGNVLKKIILILLSVIDFEVTDTAVRQQQLQLQCVSACLRLLAGMLNEPHWRSRLGLGGSAAGPKSDSMSTACAYLFDLLLSMRRVISTLTLSTSTTSDFSGCERNSADPEVIVQRIDFTVALFMQHSVEARGLFVQQSVHTQLAIVEAGRANNSNNEVCVFQQHVNTLVSAVAILHSPAAVTTTTSCGNNTTAQGSGGKGVMSPEAKRSLQGIKARTSIAATTAGVSVSTGASTVKRGAGSSGFNNNNKQNTSHPAVGQSTSTWATSRTSVTSTTNSSKWRDKSRSYQWNKDKQDASATLNGPHRPTTTAAGGTGSQELPDKVKRQLWAALTVLSQVMPGCPTAVDWAIDLQLHQSLSKLLRFAARYSISTLVTSSTSSTATSNLHQLDGLLHNNITTEMLADPCWVPSNGMLAAGIYSLCCAFTYQHAHAKQCFLSTGEAAAAVLHNTNNNSNSTSAGNSTNGSTGTALHQLITLGVTRSMAPVSRWLSLGLAGSLLSGAKNSGSSAMKSTFSQMVALTLQRSLHSAYSDPEAVVPLLTTLTSFLATEEDLAHLTQLCRRDSAGLLKHLHMSDNHLFGGGGDKNGGKDAMVEDFKRVTFPELLSWVTHSTNTSKDTTSEGRSCEVAVAVSRVLGRISLVDSKAHRTVGNLLCEDTLGLLCANYTSSHPLVSNVSALALWHIVHHSEKGKHLVRDLLSRLPHNTSTTTVGEKENMHYDRNYDVDENEEDEEGLWEVEGVQKARFVIDSLRSAT